MVSRIGGARRKSRKKMKKHYRKRGKVSVSRFYQEFDEGERVSLVAEPAVQKGMYRAKYHGRTGLVTGKQGDCYKVQVKEGRKKKTLIVHPVHLKRLSA